jgi:hypothetical protein
VREPRVRMRGSLITAALLAASCNAAPRQADEITVWQPRGQWSGRELLQTDPFISTSGLLRITWEARTLARVDAAGTPGTIRIVLHSDVSGRALTPVVEHRGSGSGVKYITEDPRSFFFVIESKGVEWTVDVAEGLAATRK